MTQMNHKMNLSLRQNQPTVSHQIFAIICSVKKTDRILYALYGHPNFNLAKAGKGPTYFSYRNEGEYEPMDQPQDE